MQTTNSDNRPCSNDNSSTTAAKTLSDARKIAVVWAILFGISLVFIYLAGSLLPRLAFFSVQMDPSENNREGFSMLAEKDFQAAERNFLDSLDKDPRQNEPHYGLAMTYRETGQLDKASDHIGQAIAMAPENTEYYLVRAGIYKDQQKVSQAVASVSEALRIDPSSDKAYQMMGFILSEQQDWNSAREALRKALALNADNIQAERMLALTYMAEGRPEQAIGGLQRLVAKEPADAEFHFYLGLCLLETENVTQALEQFRIAVDLEPSEYQDKVQYQLEKQGLSLSG